MNSQNMEPQLGAESFSCPHCNAVAHQDWYSLFLKPENATDVVVLTLEALMLAKGNESDQFLQRLKDNVMAYEYQEHPRNLKVKLLNPMSVDATTARDLQYGCVTDWCFLSR